MAPAAVPGPPACFEGAHVEPFDFGPPTGLGLRARQPLARGDVVLSIGPLREVVVTAARARELLAAWLPELPPCAEGRAFDSTADLLVGQVVQVLSDEAAVLCSCRACGISEDNDPQRCAVIGSTLRVVDVDASDDTAQLRVGSAGDVWLAARALRAATDVAAASRCLSDENALALCVLQMRHYVDDGALHPTLASWVRGLPAQLWQPHFWSEAQLQELQGSNYEPRARALRPEAERVHRALCRSLGGERAAGTLDQFLWALAVVRSRTFSLDPALLPTLLSQEDVALIPYLDYVNHDPALPACQGHVRESADGQSVELVALAACAAGHEVLTSYGAKPGADLLMGWGFMPAGNPHDAVELELTLDRATLAEPDRLRLCWLAIAAAPAEPGEPASVEVLRDAGHDGNALAVLVLLTLRRPLPAPLLGLCRLERLSTPSLHALRLAVGEPELARRLQAGEQLAQSRELALELGDAWLRAEQEAVASLLGAARAMLARYPTTLEEDEARLAAGVPEVPVALALALRMQEKRILRAAAAACEAVQAGGALPRPPAG